MGFLGGPMIKKPLPMQETQVWSFSREDPLEKEMQPTLVFLPGKLHGQRSLEDHSPWGHKRVGHNFVVTQLLSHVQLFVAPWTAAHQASLSSSLFWNLLKLMSIESMMPSNHLILYCPLLFLPSIFPSIRNMSQQLKKQQSWALQ